MELDKMEINKSEPDWLDIACDKIYNTLSDKHFDNCTLKDKIGVLEQVIEYINYDIIMHSENDKRFLN